MGSPTGRGAHRPSRRESVLAAGLAEFTQRGYSATAMSSIARRAGMSTSSVYYHFPSKDSILTELLDRAATSLREALVAVVPAGDRADAARRVAGAFVGWLLPDPRWALLVLGAGMGGTAAVEADRRRHNVELTRTVAHLLRGTDPESTDLLVRATALVVLFGELARAQTADPLPETRLRAAAGRLVARLVP